MSRRVWCEGGDRMCKLREKPVGRKPCQTSSCKVWETGDWNVVSYPEGVNVAKHASGKYVTFRVRSGL
jgi:hypothetical protein